MRQCMYYEAHEMLKKAHKHDYKTFWTDGIKMINTANLCPILGGIRKVKIQYDKIALEDHSCIATRSRNEKSWKFSLNAGVQGPLNQRSGFKQAKQTCKRITGSGNKPIPTEQQVRQRRDQQGLEEHAYRLDASPGWRYYLFSTTHSSSSSSSRWQPSSDLWST